MPVKLHKMLFYTLVLGVYGIFFSVECLYNFEGQGSSTNYLHFVSIAREGARTGQTFQNLPVHSSASRSLRLNKRYHQEEAPPFLFLSPALPEYTMAPSTPGCYCQTALPEPAFLNRPLRGPPALG
jgi:hypothetical protein